MRLSRISIINFRSIKEANISFDKVIALVGSNNAGKSAYLRALNAFFNFEQEEQYFHNGSHKFSARSKPYIELTFENLPNRKKITSIKENNKIRIQFTFNSRNGATYKYYKNRTYHDLPKDTFAQIKEYIAFIFIPPARDHSQISNVENSILKELVEAYLNNKTKQRDVLSSPVKKVFF